MLVSGKVRASILAMPIAEVWTELKRLWTLHPEMQLAHRECDGMSDDDLRSALEDAMSLIERESLIELPKSPCTMFCM